MFKKRNIILQSKLVKRENYSVLSKNNDNKFIIEQYGYNVKNDKSSNSSNTKR